MARRGSGLASNPLAQLQDDEKQEQAIVQAAQADGVAVRDLPINTVAPDPENPESRLIPDAALVASMKAEGQLQPGVVVPVEVWAGYGNDRTALPDGTEYVINYGHRRWAAARAAGLDTYRAIVSDTLKDNITKRVHRLIENVQREDLTPLEEAQEYHRLMDVDKLSQREISRRTGIPQPHISKRLSLRNLPPAAQEALSKAIIPVEAAVELAKMAKEPDRIQRVIDAVTATQVEEGDEVGRINRSKLAVETAHKEYNLFKAAKDKADKRKKLTAEGIVIIDNPTTYFTDKPGTRWDYAIQDDDKIAAARETGTLAAYVITGEHVEYYLTELPPTPEPEETEEPEAEATEQPGDGEHQAADPAASDDEATPADAGSVVKIDRPTTIPAPRVTAPQETPEQRERREKREQEQREREAAAKAREAACARIAAKAPSRETLTARLARRILLVEEDHSFDAQQLAVKWLKAASVVDGTTTVYTLFGYDTNIDAKLAARAAYVYDLALSEIRAQESTDYDAEDALHIRRLIEEADYEPAEWEQQALLVAADDN